jgi:hypothetical protein
VVNCVNLYSPATSSSFSRMAFPQHGPALKELPTPTGATTTNSRASAASVKASPKLVAARQGAQLDTQSLHFTHSLVHARVLDSHSHSLHFTHSLVHDYV